MIKRVIIFVLDSFGVGELPDASNYGDEGSNTLKGIYDNSNLNVPNLKELGLFNIDNINISNKTENPIGAYGKAAEKSVGKNSPIGHWEMAGYVKEIGFSTYPNAFPEELLNKLIEEANLPGVLCNEVGSGTVLLAKYGEESMKTGKPIIYTSADSVFQIAAHEDVISVEKLNEICKIARNIIDRDKYNIGTVISRPYVGTNSENFKRTYNRRDFEFSKFGRTMLDVFYENQKEVIAIGKIEDLFVGRGITKSIHTNGNTDGILQTIDIMKKYKEGMIFTNLVDFDMLYGHRNNIEGYKNALEEFDSYLPEIISNLDDEDMLIITADHGCDPSTPSTNHSREYIPILIYGNKINNVNIGTRETFADISATILDAFKFEKLEYGESFLNEIKK